MIRKRATQTLSVSVIVQPPPAPTIAVQQTAVNFGTIEAGQNSSTDDYDQEYRYCAVGDNGYSE